MKTSLDHPGTTPPGPGPSAPRHRAGVRASLALAAVGALVALLLWALDGQLSSPSAPVVDDALPSGFAA